MMATVVKLNFIAIFIILFNLLYII
jgi:hypothetical protein